MNSNPPGSAVVGAPVSFGQSNTGLSGDGPYTFGWDFGDGTTSTDSNPAKVYGAAGTYTVTLVMTDGFGCPSSPVSIRYEVLEPTPTQTPLPTSTPTATDTPTPTNTPAPPADTPVPPPPQPADTPVPSPVSTLTTTPVGPVLLPETGDTDRPSPADLVFLSVGGGLLTAIYLLLRRHLACHD